MTRSRETPERTGTILGLISGFILWLIWGFLIYSLESSIVFQNYQMDIHTPLGAWIYLGPLPVIVGAGYYYFIRTYLPDLKKRQQFAALIGGTIGFVLWTVMMVTLPDIMYVSSLFPNLAGWLFMIVLIVLFKWRVRPDNMPDN